MSISHIMEWKFMVTTSKSMHMVTTSKSMHREVQIKHDLMTRKCKYTLMA